MSLQSCAGRLCAAQPEELPTRPGSRGREEKEKERERENENDIVVFMRITEGLNFTRFVGVA